MISGYSLLPGSLPFDAASHYRRTFDCLDAVSNPSRRRSIRICCLLGKTPKTRFGEEQVIPTSCVLLYLNVYFEGASGMIQESARYERQFRSCQILCYCGWKVFSGRQLYRRICDALLARGAFCGHWMDEHWVRFDRARMRLLITFLSALFSVLGVAENCQFEY